jgi:two-component system cell cycle sensor histidine kinase/response regulator CckA
MPAAANRTNGMNAKCSDTATGRDERAQRIEALGRLAGGLAHDFNNLLTVILGYSEMLMSTLPENDATRIAIADIAEAGRRGAGITRQLMLFSGRLPVRPQLVSISERIVSLSSRLRPLLAESVQLEVAHPRLPLDVRADADQINDLLLNLAKNARDMMSGGGTLRIDACRRQVASLVDATGATAAPGEYVVIQVADNGEGMDAVTCARLFEPFFATEKNARGSGLRMSAVYGIVKRWGGFITVQSTPGQGSTIEVYLPHAGDLVTGLERSAPLRL